MGEGTLDFSTTLNNPHVGGKRRWENVKIQRSQSLVQAHCVLARMSRWERLGWSNKDPLLGTLCRLRSKLRKAGGRITRFYPMIDPSEDTTLALPGVLLPRLHGETANLADKHSCVLG